MRRISNVAFSADYMPLYNKIPIDKKPLAASISGFKSCHGFVKSKFMTRHYYNKFLEFYYKISKDKLSNNFVGQPIQYDSEQVNNYFEALNNWIDSDEYSMSTLTIRSKIIAEQKRISKQINKTK